MTYNDLIHAINTKHQDRYFELLLVHSDIILKEIGRTNKQKVATDLNQHPTQFSLAYKYILAYDNLKA